MEIRNNKSESNTKPHTLKQLSKSEEGKKKDADTSGNKTGAKKRK
jgi:hypothetical protein